MLHVQEPILYVIRKIHRQSPESGRSKRINGHGVHACSTIIGNTYIVLIVIPLADYYILGGVVYQCPDLWSIIHSRLVSDINPF